MKILSAAKATALALLLLSVVPTMAQTFKATYTYDANGNRISATVIYISTTPQGTSPEFKEDLTINEKSSISITIAPNPTQGNLRVDITSTNQLEINSQNSFIKVWDMQGKLLVDKNSIGLSNSIDLSNYSNGVYILKISINGALKEYKIVKR